MAGPLIHRTDQQGTCYLLYLKFSNKVRPELFPIEEAKISYGWEFI